MKNLIDYLKKNKFAKAQDNDKKAEIVANSVFQYLQKNQIINGPMIEKAIWEIYQPSGKLLGELSSPTQNKYISEKGIKYALIRNIVKKIAEKYSDFEVRIKRKGFGKSTPIYVLFLNEKKCYEIFKKNLGKPKKILEYPLKKPKEFR